MLDGSPGIRRQIGNEGHPTEDWERHREDGPIAEELVSGSGPDDNPLARLVDAVDLVSEVHPCTEGACDATSEFPRSFIDDAAQASPEHRDHTTEARGGVHELEERDFSGRCAEEPG